MPAAPTVRFGIIFQVHDKPVTVTVDANALKDLKTKGLDLALPAPVDLGQIGSDLQALSDIVARLRPDAKLPAKDELPDPIPKMLDKAGTLRLRVDELRLHIPPPGNAQDLRYSLRIAAEWDEDKEAVVGPIQIKGFAFGIESPPATK
jgi:hypothetical protein